jgi:hypothetical protein
LKSLANQVMTLNPIAQAPETRVFIIPIAFVELSRIDKLNDGINK